VCSKLNWHVQMKVAEMVMSNSDEDRLSHCHRNVNGFVDFESDLVDCTFAKLGMLFAKGFETQLQSRRHTLQKYVMHNTMSQSLITSGCKNITKNVLKTCIGNNG